jgi:hypothetical protein
MRIRSCDIRLAYLVIPTLRIPHEYPRLSGRRVEEDARKMRGVLKDSRLDVRVVGRVDDDCGRSLTRRCLSTRLEKLWCSGSRYHLNALLNRQVTCTVEIELQIGVFKLGGQGVWPSKVGNVNGKRS